MQVMGLTNSMVPAPRIRGENAIRNRKEAWVGMKNKLVWMKRRNKAVLGKKGSPEKWRVIG